MPQVSGYSHVPFEELSAAAAENQTLFSQIYFKNNMTDNLAKIKAAEDAGSKGIVWAVDSPGSPDRQRAARYDVTSENKDFTKNTWDLYHVYRNATRLPIVLKGIQNVEDAQLAVQHGVEAIILSNHGARNLDGSASSLEIALEIYQEDPDLFNQIEVLADGGIRYGTDALRLLALGVKAVSALISPPPLPQPLFLPVSTCFLGLMQLLTGSRAGRNGPPIHVRKRLRRGGHREGGEPDALVHHERRREPRRARPEGDRCQLRQLDAQQLVQLD